MLKISKYFIAGLMLLMSFSALSQTTSNSDTYVVVEIQSDGVTDRIRIRPQVGTPIANPSSCANTNWYMLENEASSFQRDMLLAAVNNQREIRIFIAAGRCTASTTIDATAGFPVVIAIRYPNLNPQDG